VGSLGNQILVPRLVEIGLAFDFHGHFAGYQDAPLLAMGMVRKSHAFFEYEEHNLFFIVVQAITGNSGDGNFNFGQGKNFGR
jgi:hypothetical protein